MFNLGIKLIKEFFSKWKNFGFSLAYSNLIWWICFYLRPPFAYKLSTWAIQKKTQWFDKYFNQNYADIIRQYKNPQCIKDGIKKTETYNIWIFWEQGEENMPPLVKACYKQLKHFNKNVVLLAHDNVLEYITIDSKIIHKMQKGIISQANYSDIIRNTLLTKYGGFWIDATVWCSRTIPIQELKIFPIFTPCGKVSPNNKSIRFWTSFDCNWSSWCLWANQPGIQLFSFVSSMLQAIGERENCWPDYVIQDYLIHYACRNLPETRLKLENCQSYTGAKRNDFATIMNEKFDSEVYKIMIKSDFVFKLSFRSQWKVKTETGYLTFYGRILEGIISINN